VSARNPGARLTVLLVVLVALGGVARAADPEPPAAQSDELVRETTRGPVRARVRVRPRAPVIGDPIELAIEVTAEAGIELLMPEFGEALDRLRIVDFAPSESVDDSGATLATQRYTLQADRSGALVLPAIAIEFVDRRPGQRPAPENEDAYELLTEPLELQVASVLPADAPLELRPVKDTLSPLAGPGGPLWGWLLAAALGIAAGLPFAVRAWLAARTRAVQRSAYDVARAALDVLIQGSRPASREEMDAFFVRLSDIVRRYLEDRFGLHSPELTTEEFLEALAASPDLTREHRLLLQRFLVLADLVKFARHMPEAEVVQDSLDAALRFLDETRATPGSEPAAAAPPPAAEPSHG